MPAHSKYYRNVCSYSLGFFPSLSFHSSVALSCPTLYDPWTVAHQASLSITNSQYLCKLMSIESVMPSNCFILCHPLFLLPSIFPSIRVFSSESVLSIKWPKYWSFSFSIIPSNEYSGLISFRMDWLDLLAVQGTLKSLLQHHSSKASIFRCSAFFISRSLCVAVWLYLKISLGDLSVTVNKDLCHNFNDCKELLILIMLQCRLYSLVF